MMEVMPSSPSPLPAGPAPAAGDGVPTLTGRAELVRLLRQKEAGFSPAFRRIAGFLLSDYRRACFMTAAQLAKAAGVSQPSVTRFVSYLGFESYAQFLRSLQAIVRAEVDSPSRLRALATAPPSGQVPYADLLRDEMANLERLTETLASEEFALTARQLAESQTVVVAGFRASRPLAEYLAFFLAKVHPDVRPVVRADSCAAEALLHLDPAATRVVSFAFPRYARETQEFQRLARRRGFPVVLITDSPVSPLVAEADGVLMAPVAFRSLFDCYCAPMALANALVQEVARSAPHRTESMLRRFEDLAAERQLFVTF